MKFQIAIFLIVFGSLNAFAEVRVINTSGQDLKVDILHRAGQAHDIPISSAVALSAPIGPKTPFGEYEMMVVKSSDGSELFREDVKSGSIYAIQQWNPITYTYFGNFKGDPSSYIPRVINLTGQKILCKATMPDFSFVESKLDGANASGYVSVDTVGRNLSAGDKFPTEWGFEGEPPTTKAEMVCGAVYLATKAADGTIQIEKVGVH